MRELKLRYTFKRKSDGHIYQIIVSIESLEQGYGQIFSMLKNTEWELVSRERFIGLHDKNSNEIYEGDIITWVGPEGENIISVVVFESGVYWTGECGYDMILGIDFKGESFEVIGNIHENPELLNPTVGGQ